MSKYSDSLKNPKWQKRRLEILSRDSFTCQYCGDDKKTLVVHHKAYIQNHEPWEYEDEYLITLCEKCHDEFHKSPISMQDACKNMSLSFMLAGFSPRDINLIASGVRCMDLAFHPSVVAECISEFVNDCDAQDSIIHSRILNKKNKKSTINLKELFNR